MNQILLEEYNQKRNQFHISKQPSYSFCYVPYTTLYFDLDGNVRVCCRNWKHVLGNVSTHTISEMWHGEKLKQLRDALKNNSLELGCQSCALKAIGTYANHPAMSADHLPYDLEWPQSMHFAINNTCNLECIMCTGKFSSSIRKNREHLPPTKSNYSDSFFEQLKPFLPHLKQANFLGGEPFLQRDCFKIWDMLIDLNPQCTCAVSTNGNVLNQRVKDYLNKLKFHISVSIDGFAKETIEHIRTNSTYEEMQENIQYFIEYSKTSKRNMSFSYCFMNNNWNELGNLCKYAESLSSNDFRINVIVHKVTTPKELSLYSLEKEKLEEIIRKMEEESVNLLPTLTYTKNIWLDQLANLRLHAKTLQAT